MGAGKAVSIDYVLLSVKVALLADGPISIFLGQSPSRDNGVALMTDKAGVFWRRARAWRAATRPASR